MRFKGIGFSGKNRAGKDSAAGILPKLDDKFGTMAFAHALKLQAAAMTGKSDNFYFDEQNKLQYRQFLIALGTAGRAYDPQFWINKTIKTAAGFPDRIPVITDVRYVNEAKALREAGFMLVRINCPDEVRVQRGGKVIDDESETGLDQWTDWDLQLDSSLLFPDSIARIVMRQFDNANEAADRLAIDAKHADVCAHIPRCEDAAECNTRAFDNPHSCASGH